MLIAARFMHDTATVPMSPDALTLTMRGARALRIRGDIATSASVATQDMGVPEEVRSAARELLDAWGLTQ